MRATSPQEQRQIVLVFQGGGALGAYQAGVYQALHEAGIEPDWIIGTSIGAINASLIAGNEPENRLDRLRGILAADAAQGVLGLVELARARPTRCPTGRHCSAAFPVSSSPIRSPSSARTVPLGRGQGRLLLDRAAGEDADRSRRLRARQALHAAADGRRRACAHQRRCATSTAARWRSRRRHVMASGALPPAFPAVRIDGELYWDGGILSNTPTEAIFDDNPRRNSLIFAVHMWNPMGPEPETIWEVLHRQKDIQYSSRVASHIARQRQVHRLRHVISELVKIHARGRAQASRWSRSWPRMAA